jgi:hypothetical protein
MKFMLHYKLLFALCVVVSQISCVMPPLVVPTKVIGTMADDKVYRGRGNTSNKGIVESGKIHPPVGKIVLIRSNTDLCAIQFGESQLLQKRETPKKEPIISRLYTWHIIASSSNSTGLITLDSGGDVIRVGPNTSSHFTPGIDYAKNEITCGSRFALRGDIGGWLYTAPLKSNKSSYEFAATPWNKVSDIVLNHSKLQWYKHTTEANTFIIIDLDF